MFRQLLTTLSFATALTITAQTDKSAKVTNKAVFNDNTIVGRATTESACSRITTQTSSTLTLGTVIANAACPTGGYIVGSNCYKDKEKANFFPSSTYSAITSPSVSNVAFNFYRDATVNEGTKGTGTVTMSIYNGNATSGPTLNAIATATASLPAIVAAQTNTATSAFLSYTFNLTTPAAIPASGFFASISIPQTVGDTVVIWNQNAATVNYGWERTFNNLWYDMPSSWGVNFFGNLSIYPTICGTINTVGITKTAAIAKNITIMPNPSNGIVNVNVSFDQAENLVLTVTNSLGQEVFTNIYDGISKESLLLDLTNQTNGIYFVTVNNGADKMVQRLFINKW